jgi:broad specificity phosphatase PhoE
MNNVYFIRHGKSSHNIGFDKHGEEAYTDIVHTDSNLVEKGIDEALNLKIELEKVFDDIYKKDNYLILISPLQRCITTGLLAFGNYEIPIERFICIEELQEYPCGVHTPNKRTNLNTLIYFYGDKIDFSNIKINTDIYWNKDREETIDELKNRIKDFKKKLEEYKKTYKNIFIITHNSFMSQYLFGNTDANIKHCQLYLEKEIQKIFNYNADTPITTMSTKDIIKEYEKMFITL